jgi:hypothetical protein
MTAVWPEALPRPLRDQYSGQRVDPRRERTVAYGTGNDRPRFSAVGRYINAGIMMDLAQRQEFWRWYIDELREGVLPFWMPDFELTGAALTDDQGQMLTDDDGRVITMVRTNLCRIATGSVPTEGEFSGQHRLVSIQLEVLPI